MARHRWAWAKDGSATATCEVCGLKQAPERRPSKRKTRAWGYTDTVTVTVWTHRDGRVEYGNKTPPCEPAEAQTWLRPCPFCGGSAQHYEDSPRMYEARIYVGCPSCKARGPKCATADEAVGAWNRRA